MHATTSTQPSASSHSATPPTVRRLTSEEALATHASSGTPVLAGFLAYFAAAPFALLAGLLLVGGMF
jgi:hypothetical protein